MKLFSYEWRKLMGNRFLIVIFAMFLCGNAFVLLIADENEAFLTLEDAAAFLEDAAAFPEDAAAFLEDAAAFVDEYAMNQAKMDAEYQSILEWDEAQELRWQEEMTKGNYYWETEAKPSIYAKEGYTDRQYFEWLYDWLNRDDAYHSAEMRCFCFFALLVLLIEIILRDYALIAVSGFTIVRINVFLNIHHYIQSDNVLQNANMQAAAYVRTLFARYKGVNFEGCLIGMIPFVVCLYFILMDLR